jgi:wyosine [tRNA(Phe)-imidazoG37] synthetase (radical SAM superfamily)
MTGFRYLFGPVPSRRFGRSLGVDLLGPAKRCSLNCVFCQLGRTPATRVDREAAVPVNEVLAELDRWLAGGGTADVVTLAGTGEPTLHPDFAAVLEWVRVHRPLRSLLLSNGTLFTDPAVRAGAALADTVKVSLPAADEEIYRRIVRPHPAVRLAEVLDGYRLFRRTYRGDFVVEVMIVPGWNDAPEAIDALARMFRGVKPDRIQLNTPVRPPAEAGIRPCTRGELLTMAGRFQPAAEVPGAEAAAIRANASEGDARIGDASIGETIAALVCRHPIAASAIGNVFGLPPERTRALLRDLAGQGRVRLVPHGDDWMACPPAAGGGDATARGDVAT